MSNDQLTINVTINDGDLYVEKDEISRHVSFSSLKEVPIDFYKRWKEALLSGNYTQRKYSLWDNNKYCCLGVACKISGVDEEAMDGLPYTSSIDQDDISHCDIPDYFHLDCINEFFGSLNDDIDLSFEEIAEVIEKICNLLEEE